METNEVSIVNNIPPNLNQNIGMPMNNSAQMSAPTPPQQQAPIQNIQVPQQISIQQPPPQQQQQQQQQPAQQIQQQQVPQQIKQPPTPQQYQNQFQQQIPPKILPQPTNIQAQAQAHIMNPNYPQQQQPAPQAQQPIQIKQQMQPNNPQMLVAQQQPQAQLMNPQLMQQQTAQVQPGVNRIPPNIGKNIQPQPNPQAQPQQQQQIPQVASLRPIQSQPQTPQSQQIIQSHTPPIVAAQAQQNAQQMGQQQQNYNQQMYAQQQQQPQNFQYVQQNQQQVTQQPLQIWEGGVEWQEKDRNNPNNPIKVKHVVNASIFSFTALDQSSGQYVPEVSPALAQTWPQKIPLQLLSKQILDILNQHCPPPTRNLLLITEGNSQELKSTLQSIGVCLKFFFYFMI